MKIIEKIVWAIIALYIIIGVADMVLPPAPVRPLDDAVAREMYIQHLNNIARDSVQKELNK